MSSKASSNDTRGSGPPVPFVKMEDILPKDFATRLHPSGTHHSHAPIYGLSNPLAGHGFYPHNSSYGGIELMGPPAVPTFSNRLTYDPGFAPSPQHGYGSSWPTTHTLPHNIQFPHHIGPIQLMTPPSDHAGPGFHYPNPVAYHQTYTAPGFYRAPYWIDPLPSQVQIAPPQGQLGTYTDSNSHTSVPTAATSYPSPSSSGRASNCGCGYPDDSGMVSCSDKKHTGNRKFHLQCADNFNSSVEEDFICNMCTNQELAESLSCESDYVEVAPLPTTEVAKPAKTQSKGAWSAREDEMAIKIMKDIKKNRTCRRVDEIWEEMSRQLSQNGIVRTAGGVKNQWNRRLRSKSGIDERATPRPDLMQTGLLKTKQEMSKAIVRKPNRIRQQYHVMKNENDNDTILEEEE